MKIKRFTEEDGHYNGELMFYCEGCKQCHSIRDSITKSEGPRWAFNGDFEKPTVSPSILVTWPGNVCHSFIENGNIRYLSDCTHELAGKTLPLTDIEKDIW